LRPTAQLQLIASELEQRLGPDAIEQAMREGGAMSDDMIKNAALKAIASACYYIIARPMIILAWPRKDAPGRSCEIGFAP